MYKKKKGKVRNSWVKKNLEHIANVESITSSKQVYLSEIIKPTSNR